MKYSFVSAGWVSIMAVSDCTPRHNGPAWLKLWTLWVFLSSATTRLSTRDSSTTTLTCILFPIYFSVQIAAECSAETNEKVSVFISFLRYGRSKFLESSTIFSFVPKDAQCSHDSKNFGSLMMRRQFSIIDDEASGNQMVAACIKRDRIWVMH